MKYKIFTLGFALAALHAMAQEHSADKYNKSVFAQFHNMQANERADVQGTLTKAQQHFPNMKVSVDKISGSFSDIFGEAMPLPGTSLEEKVNNCFANHLSHFGLVQGEWQQTRKHSASHASFISYEQYIHGHKVVFSKLHFRFTQDGKLERLQMKNYGTPDIKLVPALSVEDAQLAAQHDLQGTAISESKIEANWVWFPIPTTQGYILRPAYAFEITGSSDNLPAELKGYVDAINGNVLYRANEVKEIDRTVKGSVYKQNPFVPASVEPLPHLMITIGSTNYYTDTAGFLSNSLVAPVNATVKLEGRWSRVRAAASGNVVPSFLDTINTNGVTVMFPTSSPSSDRHVNAYYHVSKVHDFMKQHLPTFPQMDAPLQTNVDVAGSCNAFYTSSNGGSINFYAAGGSCNSFAQCPDIIYHEYGHAISGRFYNWQGQGGMDNGGLNEGNSDIWGISMTNDPVLGKGMNSSPSSYIRRYDQAPKVYPQDIKGEVHADGEIIAGAWWDLALNLNSLDTMTQLFTKTYFDTPDGPNGTEGDVYHQVLVSALMNDDNDNNLNNGTPHFNQILTAFAKHGIYLLGDAIVNHTDIPHPPANTPININTSLSLSTPGLLGDVKVFFRARGAAWDSLVMTNSGGFNYSTQLPGKPEGTIVDYYFVLYDNFGTPNGYFPNGYRPSFSPTIVTIPYQFGVGILPKTGFDFETPATGWEIGNVAGDNAHSTGIWLQAKPVGSFLNSATGQIPVQPDMDHTTGTTGKCLVTGNATSSSAQIGAADVDGLSSGASGTTTVITPMFDISGFTEPMIEYYRWYSNDKGSSPGLDFWRVQIKDSAATGWTTVDNTKQSDHAWRRRIFRAKEYSALLGSEKIHMKFIAQDVTPGSIIEAAVDDVFIYDLASVLSVENTSATNLKANIYPNPADNEVRILLPQKATGSIGVYDLTGKEIKKISLDNSTEYSISTADIPSGTYFVMVQTEKSVQTQKLSVLH